jgi:hypothetical protein
VIAGLSVQPLEDQLKALGAAAASSGTVALFHIVGVTPEAPTLEAAFQDRQPSREIDVTMPDLRSARQELSTAAGEQLDMVVLGSPHFSLAEFRQLAELLKNREKHPRVQFLVTSSRIMVELAKRAGYLAALETFGGKVTVDTCILATPMLPPEIRTLMTNSAKYAYGRACWTVAWFSMADCVRSAVEGVVRMSRYGINLKGKAVVKGCSPGWPWSRRAAVVLGRLLPHRRDHRPAPPAVWLDRRRARAGIALHARLLDHHRHIAGGGARRDCPSRHPDHGG